MNKVITIILALGVLALVFIGITVLNYYTCPKGMNDPTRWGCGYSMVEINQINCQKIGGTYFYGGIFSAGSCVK